MLYQQVAFIREKVLALKMAILHDVADKDRFSVCLLNAHYLDSDGQLWLFINSALKYAELFSKARHIRLDFFAPGKNFHVEGVGVTSPVSPEDRELAQERAFQSVNSTFVVKVDISHLEYYEVKTRPTQDGWLSILYYKWLNFMYHDESSRLLVLRRPQAQPVVVPTQLGR